MKQRHWVRAAAAIALVPATLVALSTGTGFAEEPSKFQATSLKPTGKVTGTKSPTSQLAQTDPALLNRTDATPVTVVIKLKHDAVATYTGDIAGFAATSPAVTGKQLSGSAAEKKYEAHLADLENAFASQLDKRVPGAKITNRLRTVYGGVATTVPANKIADVLAIPGVVAVQSDSLRQPLTDSSPDFIGATSLYPGLGGKANAGKGVIFGVLDTGAWPEHPSFVDKGNLGVPPGPARTCNFGDNPLTPAVDPFVCTNKLIGGAPFLATYLSNPARAAAEPFHTARDSNGHGTHTGSTTAGNALASAPVFGVERGPINGIAPGAWVSVYKVCGIQGCFGSDSAAAVQRAILDGVNVINFSISGGTNPFQDPVELAFLDAYAAGVFVSASAGNEGPGAGTVNHLSPWVATVAASTQKREFDSTLTLTAAGGNLTLHGASITAGAGPLPVVLSSAAPYSNNLCTAPAAPGTFTGKIVACQRGSNARVEKGFNVLQGGAAGMILYNPTLADVETDNHWLPTVHLADGTGSGFSAYMAANPGATASFTAGQKINGTGDVMAAFSSRGPGGNFIKPDVTAPGVQILAGHTPFRESILEGPPGELFQAIAGTSMSSPHNAGAAVLLKAQHPSWTPGQIKSALMTTATTAVLKENLSTPADPFDLGSGRINLNVAGNPGLTFDETAANMALLGDDPVSAINLNLASVNAPIMPGSITTARVAKNVTNKSQTYRVSTSAPAGASISVSPRIFTVGAGNSVTLTIKIKALSQTATQSFGEIRLTPSRHGLPRLHLPVAFVAQQGGVNLTSECTPTSIAKFATSTCTVTATNNSPSDTEVDLRTDTSLRLPIVAVSGATKTGPFSATKENVPLGGNHPGVPSIAPGSSPAGFLPLALFGVTPDAIGDEDILNYNVPPFVYNGQTYNVAGVDSNGYLVAGGGTSEDNECCIIPGGPDPARPNNMVAPFWTDLDGTGAPGILAATLTDGVNTWLVIEWQVNVFGTTSNRHFQTWIGVDGTQDISFAYDPAALPADPAGQPFLVVAENAEGAGDSIVGLPTEDLVVTSSDPTPGGSTSYTVTVLGLIPGTGTVTSSMTTPLVAGTTIVRNTIQITH